MSDYISFLPSLSLPFFPLLPAGGMAGVIDSGLIVREDPHVAAEGPATRAQRVAGRRRWSCDRCGCGVGASGRCFTRLGNLSPTLIGTNEGSYRQLMGKRATVILSTERASERARRWRGVERGHRMIGLLAHSVESITVALFPMSCL